MQVRMSNPWTDKRTGKRHEVGTTPDLDDRTADLLIEGGYAVAHDKAKAAKDNGDK